MCISIPTDGHWDCFECLASKNTPAVHIFVCVFDMVKVLSAELFHCSFTIFPFRIEKYLVGYTVNPLTHSFIFQFHLPMVNCSLKILKGKFRNRKFVSFLIG